MNTNTLKEGEKTALDGVIHLLITALLKILAGFVTGMTVVLADAIKTLAEALGVFASYVGLKLSRKSADKHFEYGYHRMETFAAFLISIGIFYLGWVMLIKGLNTLNLTQQGLFRPFAIATTILAVIDSYGLSKRFKQVGEKTNALSLLTNARNKKIDIFIGIAVLASITANYNNIPYVEGIISIIISLFIIKEGFSSTKESLFFLLDYWDDPILSRKIKNILHKEKEIVVRVNKVRLRRAGTFIFGEAFIDINPFAEMKDLKAELNILERKICEINPHIKDFVIFTHISKSEKIKVAIPIQSGENLDAKIAQTLKDTNAYIFVEINERKVGKFYVKKLSTDQKNVIALDEFIKEEKPNILVDNRLSSLVYFNLRETHHVLVYPNFPDVKTANQILELMLIDT